MSVTGLQHNGSMRQPTLFEPVARRSDPSTSHEAAKLAGRKAETHRQLALRTLQCHPEGLTDFQLSEIVQVPQTSIGVRRHELCQLGLVMDSGTRRRAPSGARAIVWIAI